MAQEAPVETTWNDIWRLPALPALPLLLALATVLLAVATREAVAPPVAVDVLYTDHAAKHDEAADVRRCLEERGAEQVWRSRSWRTPFKFFRTCSLDDARVGLQIVRWSWRSLAWREVTAFVVKDGRAEQILEYLSAIAERVR